MASAQAQIRSRKDPRRYGAPELVRAFKALLPGAHINRGRDARFLSKYMEEDALGPVEVIYAMLVYRGSGSPKDIPNFIRWTRQQENHDDLPALVREIDVAEALTGRRMPPEALPAVDYLYNDDVAGAEYPAYRAATAVLRTYLDQALGSRE